MTADERDQARRLSEYVAEFTLGRRSAASDPPPAEDLELLELRELARQLSMVSVKAPEGFQEALAARLREQGHSLSTPRRWPTLSTLRRLIPTRAPRLALSAASFVAVVLLIIHAAVTQPVVSAQKVLARSDDALEALAGPGQVLYRKWRVRTTGAAGMMTGIAQAGRVIEEWMDGGNPERVAARWYARDGRLQVAYTTVVGAGDEYRPHVYFSPGLYGEADGLLSIEPTAREFTAALDGFEPTVARALRVYLNRHYLYAPIRGERKYNHAIFSTSSDTAPELPRVLASFDDGVVLDGQPVYRVRLLDSTAVTFNWRSAGPSEVRLAASEIVRYISKADHLSFRTEERVVFEDGRTRQSIRELETTEVLSRSSLLTDPFILNIPPGTPVRWQSAQEHLAAVADALERATRTDR